MRYPTETHYCIIDECLKYEAEKYHIPNQILSTFSSSYLVATSVLIVCAKKGFEIFEQSFNGDAFHMQVVLKN